MTRTAPTTERAFEEIIEERLLTHGGYRRGVAGDWDAETALDLPTLFQFLQETQPKEWDRLAKIHGPKIEERLGARLLKELDNRGTLDMLRGGVTDYGVSFKLAHFRPVSGLNPETERLYGLNRVCVFRQLHYSKTDTQKSVDLALTVNGLPVATLELKNHFTGQTADDARRQYREDRDPREPLFAFKRRALVHFAVDPDQVWMTTRLNRRETRFLPFNKGNNRGAGNPPNPHGHRTAYLWEEILAKDSLMDILGRFLHLEQSEFVFNGKRVKREAMIFPRFHQLDAVRRLEAAVKGEGAGHNYLIQHSAGSGKSNSIAWLAYGLSSLHSAQDVPVFHSVIVVTDRRVLDKQLQDTIYQFQHTHGVVARIDRDSQQLADALEAGVKIIITTLQKFPFVLDKIDALPGRQYAVIVDEAHSSQTGEAADKLKEALTTGYASSPGESEEEWTAEDEVVRIMTARKSVQSNLSFFAFTATPKPKTYAAFGRLGTDSKPHEWHLYSMRQAIEEGFILDVLQGYTKYETFFRLSQKAEEDPRVDKKQAARAIARFVSLHPHNVAQKVQVIVEHFRLHVRHKLGGRAKAMVVTDSRRAAVDYILELRRYLAENNYTDIKALVAFSGVVKDAYDLEHTEASLNQIRERELPEKFAGEEYQLLLVADKYQTGFDQPLLHTMYVDKKLSGVRAVQTLSRLNRTYPGKEDTFVLDFVNDPEEIRLAFQQFYEAATIEENPDPNQLYDLRAKLDSYDVTRSDEIESFAQVFFQPRGLSLSRDHARLSRFLDRAVERFTLIPPAEQDDYKHTLTAFLRLYGFLSQIMPFSDAALEKFYAYGRLLVTKLQDGSGATRLQLDDEVALEYYRLQKMSEGTLVLEPNLEAALRVPSDVGTAQPSEMEQLSTIIQVLNDRFGTEFTAADQLFFDQIEQALADDPALALQAKANTIENFKYPFDDAFIDKVIERMETNQEITERIMNEDRFSAAVRQMLLDTVYRRLQEP